MKFIYSLIVLLMLSGCASAPTLEQQAAADYGSVMTPAQCNQVVEEVITFMLKDPTSALFRHTHCFRGYWGSAPILGMPVAYGYVQSGYVNAKNSFGGYVGFRKYQVLMRDGRVMRYCIHDENDLCIPSGR